MVLMKSKEIKGLGSDDRKKKLKDLRDDLMRERGVAAMGGAPISPGKIRAVRTNIARIMTIENQLKKEEERKKARDSKKIRQTAKQTEGEKTK